jgi:hypothetical protein
MLDEPFDATKRIKPGPDDMITLAFDKEGRTALKIRVALEKCRHDIPALCPVRSPGKFEIIWH